MALVRCKACGNSISPKATACPNCGEPLPKRTSLLTWLVLGTVLCVAWVGFTRPESTSSAPPTVSQPSNPEKDVELGIAIKVGRALKAASKNPNSFELNSFLIFPGGATCFEYRARNSFNALVPGKAVFDATAGKTFVAEKDGNRFVKAWNAICTKAGGQERASGLNALKAI